MGVFHLPAASVIYKLIMAIQGDETVIIKGSWN